MMRRNISVFSAEEMINIEALSNKKHPITFKTEPLCSSSYSASYTVLFNFLKTQVELNLVYNSSSPLPDIFLKEASNRSSVNDHLRKAIIQSLGQQVCLDADTTKVQSSMVMPSILEDILDNSSRDAFTAISDPILKSSVRELYALLDGNNSKYLAFSQDPYHFEILIDFSNLIDATMLSSREEVPTLYAFVGKNTPEGLYTIDFQLNCSSQMKKRVPKFSFAKSASLSFHELKLESLIMDYLKTFVQQLEKVGLSCEKRRTYFDCLAFALKTELKNLDTHEYLTAHLDLLWLDKYDLILEFTLPSGFPMSDERPKCCMKPKYNATTNSESETIDIPHSPRWSIEEMIQRAIQAIQYAVDTKLLSGNISSPRNNASFSPEIN